MDTTASTLEIKGITSRRGTRGVLQDIDARFEAGLFYAILGPNGVGKSTLVEILAGQRKPDAGTVLLGGTPVARLSPRRVAQSVAMVAQSHEVRFAFSVREVVMMGRHPHISRFGSPSEADHQLVEAAMTAADIHHLADRPVTQVSGGERQRTLFARALAQDTPVLILDEATSNLDMRHTLHLLSVVKKRAARERRCVVGVFQDINMAALFCDRLLFLKEGRVAAFGTVAETLTPETLGQVFGVNTRMIDDDTSGCRQVLFTPGGLHA